MKRVFLSVLAVMFCSIFNIEAQSIQQMQKDILSLYGEEGLSVMFVSEPNDDEPYYTFKVGENLEDHFTTLDWFHVYTQPKYEIKNYSIITNDDITLSEWRKNNNYKENECNRFIQLASWTKIPEVSLPEIKQGTINGNYAKEINREIRALYDGYITNEYKSMQGEEGGHGPSSSYSSYMNGDILSLVIEYDRAGFNTPNYQYKVYNINVTTGQRVSFEELLKSAGLTENDITLVIKASNAHQIKFTEGTIASNSLKEIPMYIWNKNLILCVKVEDLPYGDGTYIQILNINHWLPLCSTGSSKTLDGAIALPNGDGSKILLCSDTQLQESQIKSFTHVVYRSKVYPVKYLGKQNGGREFYNLDGYLFENLNHEFQIDEPVSGSAFLCDDSFLEKNKAVPFAYIYEEPGETLCGKVEKEYGRELDYSCILISFGEMGEYMLSEMLFKEDGNKELALYTFTTPTSISYLEFPENNRNDLTIWKNNEYGKPVISLHYVENVFKTPDGYLFLMDIIESESIVTYSISPQGKKLTTRKLNKIDTSNYDSEKMATNSNTANSSMGSNSFDEVQPLQTVSKENECIQPEGLFLKHSNPVEGLTVEVKEGKVYVTINPNESLRFWNRTEFSGNLQNRPYEVKGLRGKCKGIFVGDIGQDYNPTLCMLMEDHSVEMLNISNAIFNPTDELDFTSSGSLPGLSNISHFYFGGGGEYVEDGETFFSYVTIYGVDKNGKRQEIEPSYLGYGHVEHVSNDGKEIHFLDFTEDWKMTYIIKDKQGNIIKRYKGLFQEISHNEDYDSFVVKYQIESPQTISGSMAIEIKDNDVWSITPTKGLDLGGKSGSEIRFKFMP